MKKKVTKKAIKKSLKNKPSISDKLKSGRKMISKKAAGVE